LVDLRLMTRKFPSRASKVIAQRVAARGPYHGRTAGLDAMVNRRIDAKSRRSIAGILV
jgi:hypothetical protein